MIHRAVFVPLSFVGETTFGERVMNILIIPKRWTCCIYGGFTKKGLSDFTDSESRIWIVFVPQPYF